MLSAPEIFLLVMSCVILLVDLAVKSPRRTTTFALTQITLAGAFVLIFFVMRPRSLEETGVYAFGGMFVNDMLSYALKALVYFTVIVTLFYSRRYLHERQAMCRGEYFVLALLATLGMSVMISAHHFLPLYLGLEIMSLSLYAMVAMNRNSVAATEAAMKYFILGAIGSGMLLYGMSMVYGATESLFISEIGERLRILSVLDISSNPDTVLALGLVFIVAAIAFKLGAVPFHMWIPDVYHGAPTATTLFIATAPKLAGFAIMLRLLADAMPVLSVDWQSMLMVLAVLSIAVGNLVAIMQTNIKRMLAYSAISHIGFMLIGMASTDTLSFGDAYASTMFYVVTYVFTTLAAFGIILLFARAGFEADELAHYKGLNQRHPWFAAMMMIVMLSMAGIPFFVGFFAKFYVLKTAVMAGYYWLAAVAVLFSLIGAFYYLRVIKYMYFDTAGEEEAVARVESGFFVKALVSANALGIALLGIFPDFLLRLSRTSALSILLLQ
ncbi:MAG: NADH-quinone oxidoreductase subunit NuoN [Zoogloeaceae bacterium]|nr:NADH-quinone oxidoreductase subunit NuoN [Zoogloeaceae bacterium]